MWCNACNVMQCNAMQCNAMQCNAMQCNAMQCNASIIYSGLCTCTEMLWMCVLYVSFGSNVRPRIFVFVLVCSSFLISVWMFIVSKALLISSATLIVRAGGALWLNPFAPVLFNVCGAVIVECCVLYPCCMGVFGMFAVM